MENLSISEQILQHKYYLQYFNWQKIWKYFKWQRHDTSHLMLFSKHDQHFQRTFKKTDKSTRNSERSIRQLLQIKCVLDLLYTSTCFCHWTSSPNQNTVYPLLHGNMAMQCDHSCCAKNDHNNSHFCMYTLPQDNCKSFLHLNQR